MIRFAWPWAFALFLPLAFAGWRALRRTRGSAAPFPGAARLARRPTWRQRLAALPPILVLAGLAAGIVALARPRAEFALVSESKDSIAIEMAIDVSGSMMALDFSTEKEPDRTRLDVVKETFRDFVAARPDDLVGLVAFGGFATTRCPLTADHDALLAVLAETRVPGSDGEPIEEGEAETAIGDGLAMACARLAAATNVATRIAILLSDGVNNYGIATPAEATALAKRRGIKVYAIGVGTTGPVPFPAIDARGRRVRTRGYGEIDERALRRIATETGGLYFNVRTEGALQDALAKIDELEKTSVEVERRVRREERFAPWLCASLSLLCLGLLLAGPGRRSLV